MLSKFARVAHALRPSQAVWRPQRAAASALPSQAVWQPERAASALHSVGAMPSVSALHRGGALRRDGASAALTWPQCVRMRSAMLPRDQYERPTPAIFNLLYVVTTYWEVIPLLLVTTIAMTILTICTVWACLYKVDVVFTPYNRKNISRTMDLNNPPTLKMLVINQRYEPWPEMQCVLDKMSMAEKRLLSSTQECSFAK